jgi:predicted outer membrane lipoprotein
MQSLSNMQLLGILLGLTAVFSLISALSFHWFEQKARDRGMIDVVTNY